jgi:membrane associated rhomboid family serine protease
MISLAAIVVTFAVMTGRTELDPFVMSSRAFHGEPWRLVASALPHGGFVHLIFNVYWLWVLGTLLEEELGHFTTLVLALLIAAGSSAAQFAFSSGGIGLSGVGYGIVGFLWTASRIHPRFRDAMDRRTLQLFLGWGLLCIVLTITNTMPVANYAHAAGFLLGIPLAYVFLGGSLPRNLAGAVITLVLGAAFIAGASVWRAKINLSSRAGEDDREIATKALEDKQYEKAVLHFERAVALSPGDDNAWYNYGVALQDAPGHIGMTSLDAWRKALALAPKEELYKNAVARGISKQAIEAHERGDDAAAERLYRESIAVKETSTALWNLSLILYEADKHEESEKLQNRAREIDPELAKNHPVPKAPDAPPPALPAGSAGSAASAGSAGSAGSAQ